MVANQKTLSLVGLVVTIPSSVEALAVPTSENRRTSSNVGGRHSSTALGAASNDSDISRRAFVAAASSAMVGTAFVPSAHAAATRSFSAPATFGYIKRKGKWRLIGGVASDSSDDSDSSEGTSDSGSLSSSDDEDEKKLASTLDVPTKLAYNGIAH